MMNDYVIDHTKPRFYFVCTQCEQGASYPVGHIKSGVCYECAKQSGKQEDAYNKAMDILK